MINTHYIVTNFFATYTKNMNKYATAIHTIVLKLVLEQNGNLTQASNS